MGFVKRSPVSNLGRLGGNVRDVPRWSRLPWEGKGPTVSCNKEKSSACLIVNEALDPKLVTDEHIELEFILVVRRTMCFRDVSCGDGQGINTTS